MTRCFKKCFQKVVHKAAEGTGEFIGNKIADTIANSNDNKIVKPDENLTTVEEIIIPPGKIIKQFYYIKICDKK